MNALDLAIIGTVALLGLVGLKTGLLKPISGIGGLIIGVTLAIQHSAELAAMVEQNIDGEIVRRIAAFAAIVIVVTILARLAAFLLKTLLKSLVLGWLDNVAGGVAGAALGLVLSGTAIYLLTGADLEPTRDALASSTLASDVSRATIITSAKPWCSQTEGGSVEAGTCTDLAEVFNQYLGRRISGTMNGFLGNDVGSLADVVQTTLSGSPANLEALMGATDALVGDGTGALTDVVGGALEGKTAEEIASLATQGDLAQISQGAIDGILTGTTPEAEEEAPNSP